MDKCNIASFELTLPIALYSARGSVKPNNLIPCCLTARLYELEIVRNVFPFPAASIRTFEFR